MKPSETTPTSLFTITSEKTGTIAVDIGTDMHIGNVTKMLTALTSFVTENSPQSLLISLDQVTAFDEYGVLVLTEIRSLMNRRQGHFEIIKTNANVDKILNAVKFETTGLKYQTSSKTTPKTNFFVRIGDASIHEYDNVKYLISFIGSVVIALIKVIGNPKSLRFGDTITNMDKTGVNALPIVALTSFLLGLIMAFMSSLQLKQFGANIYVASLVSLAMVSELGPIMTAIIVAGRSGSAYAAEIGTMKINEEIDALFTMGFDSTMFLAVPKILAALIVVPILTLFANLFAIAGALFVGITMLGLTTSSFINQTLETLTLFEVVWGLIKSAVFALIISWTGCLRGFQARGGASSVGNAATSAVVSSIFIIILFDSIFAVIRSYW